jgi:O-antigen/teichoic acid export membrane protein
MAHAGDLAENKTDGGLPLDAARAPGDAAATAAPGERPDPPAGQPAPGSLASSEIARLILRGGAWSLVITAAGAVLSLGVHLVLARTLGAEEYGRYVVALAWMSLVVLVGKLEFDTASVRFVGAYCGTEQWSLLRGFLRRSSQIVLGISTAIMLATAVVILVFFDRFERATALSFLAACVLLPVAAMAQLKASVIQGLKHVARAQVPGLLVRPVVFVVGVLALRYVFDRPVSAPVAIGLQFGATAVGLGLTLWFLQSVLPHAVRQASERFDTRHWLRTSAGLLVISSGQIILSTNADVLIVGSLLGPEPAGQYSAASQLAVAVSFGVAAISFIALPVIADLHARGALRELQHLITHVARLGLLLSAPVLFIVILAAASVLSAFGPSFTGAAPLLILLGFDQMVGAIFGIAGYLLVMTGFQGVAARVIVGCAVLNLALTFVLTPKFGVMGAGAATTITTLVRSYLLTRSMRTALGLSLAPWRPRGSAVDGGLR